MHNVTLVEIPYRANPESLFDSLRDLPDAIWFDSGKPRSLQGRFDLMSAAPDLILESSGDSTTITDADGVRTVNSDPLTVAGELLAELAPLEDSHNIHPFVGGLMGLFSYEFGRRLIELEQPQQHSCQFPEVRLGRYLWALTINHQAQHAYLVFHEKCPTSLRNDIEQRVKSSPENSGQQAHFSLKTPFQPTTDKQTYSDALKRIKEYIVAGDCYQVNFAQHFSADCEGDYWQAYLKLRTALPSPYSAFYSWDNKAVMSLSPERFIKCSVNQVETKPIKGTIKRGTTVEEDEQRAVELLHSNKDRAENLMIVDLMRNDLARSCQPGSIRVPKLFALESFPNVHHLVSTVTGALSPNKSPLELLRHSLPGGSITGTPKKRAMEVIDELEPVSRSLYCGSMGYISATGRLDTNIAIRTVLGDGGKLHCWGGGGIVADSETDAEYQESLDKIAPLLSALDDAIN